jgi:hypothetical protein
VTRRIDLEVDLHQTCWVRLGGDHVLVALLVVSKQFRLALSPL